MFSFCSDLEWCINLVKNKLLMTDIENNNNIYPFKKEYFDKLKSKYIL